MVRRVTLSGVLHLINALQSQAIAHSLQKGDRIQSTNRTLVKKRSPYNMGDRYKT
ncbi:MAG: hypothetical protein KAF91_28060 [Nostoc sp. TH1S01]|nr:hypothetical protein [Nostoc sp. TH1S01]